MFFRSNSQHQIRFATKSAMQGVLATVSLLKNSTTDVSVAIAGMSKQEQYATLAAMGYTAQQQKNIIANAAQVVAIDALNTEEQKQIAITAGLISADGKQLVTSKAVALSKIQEAVNSGAVTAAQGAQITTTLGLTAAKNAETLSVWANIKAWAAWYASNPVGWIMAAVAAIGIIVTAITNYNKKLQETIEAGEEAASTIKSIGDEFKNIKASVDGVAVEFANLAQGVDSFGNNISLTSDEYDRYLELSNQIAEMFPDMVRGYDSNGNAILSLSGSVDTIVGSLTNLVEISRQLANQQIVDNMDTLFDGTRAKITSINQEIALLKEQLNNLTYGAPKEYMSSLGIPVTISQSGEFAIQTMVDSTASIAIANMEKALKQLGIEYTKSTISQVNESGSPISYQLFDFDIPPEIEAQIRGEFEATAAQISRDYADSANQIKKQIAGKNKEITIAWAELTPAISAWLESEVTYGAMADPMQNIAQFLVGSLDLRKLGIDTKEKLEEYIRTNILQPLFYAGPEVDAAFSELFDWRTKLQSGEISAEDFAQKVRDAFSGLFESDITGNFAALMISAFQKIGVEVDDTAGIIDYFVDQWGKLPEQVNQTTHSFESLKSIVDSAGDSLDKLKTAISTALDWRSTEDEVKSAVKQIEKLSGITLSLDDDDLAMQLKMIQTYIDGDVDAFDELTTSAIKALNPSIDTSNIESAVTGLIAILATLEGQALSTGNAILYALAGMGAVNVEYSQDMGNFTPKFSYNSDWVNNLGKSGSSGGSKGGGGSSSKDAAKEAWEKARDAQVDALKAQKDAEEDRWTAREKQLQHEIDYYDSLLSLEETYLDLVNEAKSEIRDLEKELAIAQSSYAYLDAETRATLFNDEDYQLLAGKLNGIIEEATAMYTDYQEKLAGITANNTYELEYITNEFERQYALKMKEYEVAKADLAVARARRELDNVMNERSVAMLVNGRWAWQANPEAVKKAIESVYDAENDAEDALNDLYTEQRLQALQEFKDGIALMKDAEEAAHEKIMESLGAQIDAIEALEYNIDSFSSAVASGTAAINAAVSGVSGGSSGSGGNSKAGWSDSLGGGKGYWVIGEDGTFRPNNGRGATEWQAELGQKVTGIWTRKNQQAFNEYMYNAWKNSRDKNAKKQAASWLETVKKGNGYGFASGGVADFTGMANLHGSSTNPEVIFNSADAAKLYNLVHNAPNLLNSMFDSISAKVKQFSDSATLVSPASSTATTNIYIDGIKLTQSQSSELLSALSRVVPLTS